MVLRDLNLPAAHCNSIKRSGYIQQKKRGGEICIRNGGPTS